MLNKWGVEWLAKLVGGNWVVELGCPGMSVACYQQAVELLSSVAYFDERQRKGWGGGGGGGVEVIRVEGEEWPVSRESFFFFVLAKSPHCQ